MLFLLQRPLTVAAAFAFLTRAALLHRRRGGAALLSRLQEPRDGGTALRPDRREAVTRALAGLSRRLPWRSDCLVQALAARLWLDALGAPSELRLGAWRDGGAITAHAWLLTDGEVVTGGRLDPKIAPFAPPAPTSAQALPR